MIASKLIALYPVSAPGTAQGVTLAIKADQSEWMHG
jgi:hypothetical protein